MAYHAAVKYIEDLEPAYVDAFGDDCRRAATIIKGIIPSLDTLSTKVQWRSDAQAVYAQRMKETIDLLEGLFYGYERASASIEDYVYAQVAAKALVKDGVAAEASLRVLIEHLVHNQWGPQFRMSDTLSQWNDLRSMHGPTDWIAEFAEQDEINKVRDQAESLWHRATQAYDDALRIEREARELAITGLNSAYRLLPDFLANSSFAEKIIDASPWLKAHDEHKYHVGPFVAPTLDFGTDDFPYDPNAHATPGDYTSYAQWKAKLAGGELFRSDLDDATIAYAHYLDATGADLKIDYEAAYNEDPNIHKAVDKEIADAQAEAERIFMQTGNSSFEMQGNPSSVRTLGGYPSTENWQKALGDHQVYGNSQVVVNGNQVTMKITVRAEDMYNFNAGAADIVTGAPDNDNGRFSTLGWAKEFQTYGEIERTVTWTVGDPGSAVVTTAPAEGGR